jgi:hypothetical protein
MEMQKYLKLVSKLRVCGLRVYKENNFAKFDVSIKIAG